MNRLVEILRAPLALAVAVVVIVSAAWLAYSAGLVGQGGSTLPWEIAAIAAPGATDPHKVLTSSGGVWLNSRPLTRADLQGKVVLVNFWTYSCINSLRPLPYLRAWADKYRDRGLVVVGVHTPEFDFEKDVANVRRALADQGVGYPVVVDSDYALWRAFHNSAWPAFYFVGADGRVRRQMLGEGGYDQSERLIQKLLSEAGGATVAEAVTTVAGVGSQAAPDWQDIRSGETYVGYEKATGFASEGGLRPNVPARYRSPDRLPLNRWGLSGLWRAGAEFATLDGGSGVLAFRFHARDLNLVMAPPPGGRAVSYRVRIDGDEPGADHGYDIDPHGQGRLIEPRMYQLVRQTGPVEDRTFEIEFLGTGARAYVFTFG